MKKYYKYLGWAGLALAVIGLVSYSVNSILTTFTTICLIAGGVLLLAYFILNFNNIKTGFSSRSAKFGSNAVLVVVFTLGILIVINILASRFSARVDTTASRLYSLAEQTEKVMKNLEQEVEVTGFYKAGETQSAEELLTEYSHFSPRLNYEFVDPDKNPGMAKQYNITRYSTVVVESMGKRERIDELTEENLTNAIIKVTREEIKTIYFTTGHGERSLDDREQKGLSTAKQLIQEENYQINEIMLAAADGKIPSDASVLVIAAPRSDLLSNEAEAIKSFLKQGGKVLFLLDTDAPASYSDMLSEYGFDIGNDIIVDYSGMGQLFGAGPTIPIVSQYTDHVITKDFRVMTFFPEARSVSKAESISGGATVKELAKTGQQSWAETGALASGEVSFDPNQDKRGPVSVFTIMEKTAEDQPESSDLEIETETAKTRIAVLGDADFASNGYINVQGNKDLFLNTVSWLAAEEDLISVRPRSPEDRRLHMTQKQSRLLLWGGVLLLPLVIFGLGINVYRKRRK